MTDRIRLDDMTDAQLDALYARIATLEHVAASNKRHVQAIVPDLERAEAAIARVRALAEEYPAGIDTALIHAALDVPEPAGADTTPAEPVTVTDPAWLRQQYAAAIRRAPFTELSTVDHAPNGSVQITALVDDLADAVMRVRDRHLQQLRQRLELAEHFHQDISSLRERAETAEAECERLRARLGAALACARLLKIYANGLDRGDQDDIGPLVASRIRGILAGLDDRPTVEEAEADDRAWTPPPPSSTREPHVYLSTGCRHGDHAYCKNMTGLNGRKRPGECKHCGAKCICGCHPTEEQAPAVGGGR